MEQKINLVICNKCSRFEILENKYFRKFICNSYNKEKHGRVIWDGIVNFEANIPSNCDYELEQILKGNNLNGTK